MPGLRPSRRMRVLMVNSTLHIGGAEQVAAHLAQYLDRGCFELTACYTKENGVAGAQMQRGGVDLVPIPGLREKRRDYFTALKLLRLIKQRGIQLIHTHDLHGLMDGAACRLLSPRLRHVHTFHWGNYPEREPRYARVERALWRVPDALVAVGHAQAAAIQSVYGIPSDRLRVLWNGTDAAQADICPEVEQRLPSPGIPLIASISTLIPQKGLSDLLLAAAALRQSGRRFLLMIVGQGKLRAQLESQAHELGLDDVVKFLGWINEASQRALPACDVFVQSSHWEAMSVVVLEAMAAGKPLVVTAVGENTRVVVDDETGLLVPPRDPNALAAALARLLDSADLRQRLGAAAARRYEEFFTVRHMVKRYEDLYAEVLAVDRSTLAGRVGVAQ